MPEKKISGPIASESTISMILGALVVLVVGILIYNYFTKVNKPQTTKEEKNAQTAQNKEESKEKTPATKPTPGVLKEYKVSADDSLWTIAQKTYNDGYRWVDIAKFNNLANPDHLEVGQVLKLPKIEVKGNINGAGASTTGPQAITAKTYTVVSGDYLWEIAVRACGDGYAWPKIASANKLADPDLIHSGNKLTMVCK